MPGAPDLRSVTCGHCVGSRCLIGQHPSRGSVVPGVDVALLWFDSTPGACALLRELACNTTTMRPSTMSRFRRGCSTYGPIYNPRRALMIIGRSRFPRCIVWLRGAGGRGSSESRILRQLLPSRCVRAPSRRCHDSGRLPPRSLTRAGVSRYLRVVGRLGAQPMPAWRGHGFRPDLNRATWAAMEDRESLDLA